MAKGLLKRVWCGELSLDNIEEEVELFGWVNRRRDHGGVVFIDLKDKSGIIQVVFHPQTSLEAHNLAHSLGLEYVVRVKGILKRRPLGKENPNLKTGELELWAHELEILNKASGLPFSPQDAESVQEELRLRYRYLDLRSSRMQYNLRFRAELIHLSRLFLYKEGFLEVETPFLIKSTPEGARDFLIPSRLQTSKFYALPQSPQIFKQLLIIGGIERYYQVVRAFRDEDLRADRQPEFTQLDIECSFCDEEDILSLSERLLAHLFSQLLKKEIKIPFERIKNKEALLNYGSSNPDLRFPLEIKDLSSIFSATQINIFKRVLGEGGKIFGLVVPALPQEGKIGPTKIKEWTDLIMLYGKEGLMSYKILEKHLNDQEKQSLFEIIPKKLIEEGGTVLFVGGEEKSTLLALGNLRLHIGRNYFLENAEEYKFVWVIDPPLFEWSKEENRLVSSHHPFTAPKETDYPLLDTSPESVGARAYELILNGTEIASGSIRIHNSQLQQKVFKILGLNPSQIKERFGFFIEALNYGAPPHGGIAFGLDRLIALMLNTNSIRDVIAFPKTQSGVCLTSDAPYYVEEEQLKELGICIIKKNDQ